MYQDILKISKPSSLQQHHQYWLGAALRRKFARLSYQTPRRQLPLILLQKHSFCRTRQVSKECCKCKKIRTKGASVTPGFLLFIIVLMESRVSELYFESIVAVDGHQELVAPDVSMHNPLLLLELSA